MTPPPGSVSRYAHAADRLAKLRAEWERLGSPATSSGSHGQPVAHPLLAELRATEATVTALCEACGLRASAATRPGWQAGRARASDRQPRGRLVALTDKLSHDG
jgi:hypothetical protein